MAAWRCCKRIAKFHCWTVSYAQEPADPIQKLFVEKIREYAEKQKASGKTMVDPTPEIEAELKSRMKELNVKYGLTGGENMTDFPEFTFEDPTLGPISLDGHAAKS